MQIVEQETPLRRWWREESWIYLTDDPNVQPTSLDEAVALAKWVSQPGNGLEADTDYSRDLRAFLRVADWHESYPELAFAVATSAMYTRTPYSIIARLFEMVYQRASRRELCVRARCNQGGVAHYLGDVKAVFAYTRDVMSLLPEADPLLRPGAEISVYLQRSRALRQQQHYDQAFSHALQAATLANYHAGGQPVVQSIYGEVALCAALDDRPDMAEAWLERMVETGIEGAFSRNVVRTVLHHRRMEIESALQLAHQTLALWPTALPRRPNVFLAETLIEIMELVLLSKGLPPHDIGPELI